MNRNSVYLAVFAVLCVLAGVLAGAGVTRYAVFSGYENIRFSDRAQRFMGAGPMGVLHDKKGPERLFLMLKTKLQLDEQQQAKVKEILEKSRLEIDAIGRNVRQSLMQIKERNDKQIMQLLNPNQQEEFKNLLNDFEKRFGPKKMESKHMGKPGFMPRL